MLKTVELKERLVPIKGELWSFGVGGGGRELLIFKDVLIYNSGKAKTRGLKT